MTRFCALLTFVASILAASLFADGVIDVDGFEDGSDMGWHVVGHGPMMRSYHKTLVSPGSDGSTFALRLTRDVKDGWCGLGIDHLDKLGLTTATAVRLTARNVNGVQRILVDVHCTDGSRWWCKRPLSKEGQWTEVRVAAEDFFAVNNPHHAKRPDLRAIEALWLSMDELAPAPQNGKWIMDIDSVALVGEKRISLEPATVQPQPVRWKGPPITVGIVDSDMLPPLGQIPGLPKAMASLVTRIGCAADLIAPGTLGARLKRTPPDVLVFNGPGFVVGDDHALIDFLKQGRAIWLISAAPIFSRPLQADGTGGWRDAPTAKPDPLLRLVLEAPNGVAPGWVQRPEHPLELVKPEFGLTAAGRAWWPFLPTALPATKCSVLPVNDSIARPCPPPWVTCTPLLETRFARKNWIRQNDTFSGWAMVMLSHHAGLFAGARVLFSGLPNAQNSILRPAHPAFGAVTASCLQHVATPAARVDATGKAPLDGLPPLTRANYFTYPGPIFMPINFGGTVPTDDPTFWQDMQAGGFNAIHVGLAWRTKPDESGSVIDWRKMDGLVTAAKQHGYRIVIDPWIWDWNRFRAWTGNRSIHHQAWRDRFTEAMRTLARRYAHNETVVAMYATPHTDTSAFRVDETPEGRAAWRRFVRDGLGLSLEQASRCYGARMESWNDLPLPKASKDKPFNLGPVWADYLRFHHEAYHVFMRQVIRAIRSEIPDMPILLRGPYLDVAINMKLAAEFENVAAHSECIETTVDVEGYYRSLAVRFGVPISAENGWPKSRGGPLRMALADYLMGGYRDFQYAFGGPAWARPSINDFHAAQKAARELRTAAYPRASLALLIPDTTLWASRPPNFFSMEGRPHLEFAMERLGFPFEGVSAQYPKLDGLRVIVDDGSNHVLTSACRDALAAWVRAGGTLVVFPHTGEYILDGSKANLAGALGIAFEVPAGKPHEVNGVGKGHVVILRDVPRTDNPADIDQFERLLLDLGVVRDVEIRPRVNHACFHAEGKTYLVVFNKSRKHVGAFFQESRLSAVEANLADLTLTLRPNFSFRSAREIVTGRALIVQGGRLRIRLPATRFRVIEFRH